MGRVILCMKKCNSCLLDKESCEFSKDSFKPDGLRTICRLCRSTKRKALALSMSLVEKEVLSRKQKEWYQKNKLRVSTIRAAYYEANRSKCLKSNKIRKKKRLASDPAFRITENCRNRLGLAVKSKSDNTLNLIGCTGALLKKHLESKFLPGMSWSNYGLHGWHIDHIKPCAAFNLLLASEQRTCFRYTNLQPLWAKDNLRKSATVAHIQSDRQ